MATTATFEENLNNDRIPTERQNSEELNGQQGKRKFSLSQYQERKRLRPEEFHYADTDMRIFPNKVTLKFFVFSSSLNSFLFIRQIKKKGFATHNTNRRPNEM